VPRIWFNRAYATTCHTIAMLRDNPQRRPVRVVATHTDPDSPVLAVADEAAAEPAAGTDYVAWALEFARRHDVDVLVPRERMAELAEARQAFEEQGTALMCPEAETVRLFADKATAYRAAAKLDLPVPPHRVVRDPDELHSVYRELAPLSAWVCVKPVSGVGGAGYRRLSDQPMTFADFSGEPRARTDLDAYCRAMAAEYEAGRDVPDLLVMPYLDGPEVSVDVVATASGETIGAVGRHHGGGTRRRVLVDDPEAREIASTLVREHAVGYLSNTQVRYWRGPDDAAPRPYLLELNTRAAGGLFQTRLAGVNLAWEAVRLALGEDVPPLRPRFGAAYTGVNDLVPLPAADRPR
jgi:biotin carboxylase